MRITSKGQVPIPIEIIENAGFPSYGRLRFTSEGGCGGRAGLGHCMGRMISRERAIPYVPVQALDLRYAGVPRCGSQAISSLPGVMTGWMADAFSTAFGRP